ncbi:MAG: HAD-IA family hydrolase [Bacteroidaceae bacterium]|nr:HAD-IA family hydrolase [Bacteroidaceae bacterium]
MKCQHLSVKAVVFDLDGTLLYTLQDLANALNWALRQNGMPERTLSEVRRFVGNGVQRLVQRAMPEESVTPLFDKTFSDFKRYYMVHCQETTCPYEGVPEMLLTLKAHGFKLAIVSNKLQAGVDELCNRYFRDTVTVAIGDQPSLQRKPAPDMVNEALRILGVDARDAVYVGDSDIDLLTARNSGLPCISVLWGYRDRDFLLEQGATCLAEKTDDVLDILLRGQIHSSRKYHQKR